MKKDKKIILIVIIVLLVVLAGSVWWYLGSRSETPENAITLVKNEKEELVDISKLSLTSFSGKTVNGKGEEKDVSGEGIKLADVISTSDFSEVSVIAEDAYSATVKKEDMDNAWLQIEEGTARLIVLGDSDSKRNVKNVVRIEVK
ncbi:hypothetical protein SAMN02910369_00965 [Lachnospiraceae bacterium NE2001]|nr:hypothetical protein SAMN02910369_00965 [Lachnospiraceae bacterium NE2001]